MPREHHRTASVLNFESGQISRFTYFLTGKEKKAIQHFLEIINKLMSLYNNSKKVVNVLM